LVNTDPSKIRLDAFEEALRRRIDDQALRVYGITIRQVGLERLTLPSATLTATIDRMRAERATVAAQRAAEGSRLAAQIQSDADRDSRVLVAQGKASVADIEAKSRIEAANIYKNAYAADPQLYTMLRSLDSLNTIVGTNTTLILRTDAAPFHALVENAGGSDAAGAGKSK
jgi:membrane protease subunit HflC